MEIPDRPRVDGRWENYVVEVKHQTRALRVVQQSLLELATYLDAEPGKRGVLLLVEPRITDARLQDETTKALSVLREDIRDRVLVVAQREGTLDGLPACAEPGLTQWLAETASREGTRRTGVRLKRPSAESQVLELLVEHWMLRVGPVMTKSLEQDSGFSYPAVATALDRLQRVLRRTSDRRVELTQFPRDDWARLVAGARETRSTLWFVDRSGRPRSPRRTPGSRSEAGARRHRRGRNRGRTPLHAWSRHRRQPVAEPGAALSARPRRPRLRATPRPSARASHAAPRGTAKPRRPLCSATAHRLPTWR